jgi:uncharacterized repeat protein (TIGR02543 family)
MEEIKMKKRRRLLKRPITLLMALSFLFSMFPGKAMAYSEAEQWNDWETQIGDCGYGYIFKLSGAPKSQTRFFALLDKEEPAVEEVPYTENTYTAGSLDDVRNFVYANQIEFIEPDYPVYLYDWEQSYSTVNSNDKYYQDKSQWNIDMLNVPDMWEYGLEGQNLDGADAIIVAVIDSGIKYNHEDINWDNVLTGKSWVATDQTNVNDTFGHGTFVSGIIMAIKDNEVGIAGIAPNIKLLPLRVFLGKTASTSDIISALYYAVDNGADVINMSLGSEINSAAFEAACQYAVSKNVILVAAAGNDGDNTPSYPAQYESVIGVGSVNADGVRSAFSQKGKDRVFVTAPGENLTSTYHQSTSSYATSSGTSFSSPEVAALAAVAKSIDNDITQQEFAQLLMDTSDDLGETGRDDFYGYGLVDFKEAVESLLTIAEQSTVSFEFLNEAGGTIDSLGDLTLEVYSANADGQPSGAAAEPEENGTYLLKTGEYDANGKFIPERYCYQITGNDVTRKYENASGAFTAITEERTVNVTLESRVYYADFSVKDTGGANLPSPAIAVTRANGTVISKITSGENEGKYGVKTGNYKYKITAADYYPAEGMFTIDDANSSIAVTMLSQADVASVDFEQVNNAGETLTTGNTVSVFDEGGNLITRYEGYYRLAPGIYRYEADSSKYYQETRRFEIKDTDKGKSITITINMAKPTFWVRFVLTPLKAKVQLFDEKGEPMINRSAGEYNVPIGKYSYEVTCDGYKTVKENLTITENSGEQGVITIKIAMTEDNGGGTGGEGGGGGTGSGGGGGIAAKEYTVSFSSNGGSSIDSQTINENSHAEKPADPAKKEHEFTGWYTDSACTKAYDFDSPVTANLTLYAGWKKLDAPAKTFIDIADNYWGRTAIVALAKDGIINGYGDETFRPENPITRAEFLTILMNALNLKAEEPITATQFKDVKPTDWFANAVLMARACGVVSGDERGSFNPNDKITREEMFTMTYRAMLKLNLIKESKEDTVYQSFSDHKEIFDYAIDAIQALVKEGLVNGDANRLTPKSNATRAESAQFIYNVLAYLK